MNYTEIFLPSIADGEDKTSILANSIRKNYRHIKKWAKRKATNCFRIYNQETSKYPLAIDFYDGRYLVQYFSEQRESVDPPLGLVEETHNALKMVFNASEDLIFWRTRAKRKESRQYEKLDSSKNYFTVLEYGVKFKVNLQDYLDSGLFLDHRETRQLVAAASKGKRLLNLFAYTSSFSVHAAFQGALYTKSVDMSNTYTKWSEENFKLNALSLKKNDIVRADCLKFLDAEISGRQKYDVIVIDPPTISRSKKMDRLFDVQNDYEFLISKSLLLLSEGGVIFFSTNAKKFSFDTSLLPSCKVVDISEKTMPIDFQGSRPHRCWKITRI